MASIERVNIPSFVTGSYAYGTPHAKSDIDLVVLVSEADLEKLQKRADKGSARWETPDAEYRKNQMHVPQAACLRFGDLNLITCTNDDQFELWRKGTKMLKKEAPVERSRACYVFAYLRALSEGCDEPEAKRIARSAEKTAQQRDVERQRGAGWGLRDKVRLDKIDENLDPPPDPDDLIPF
jgi:hypothetical protein